MSPYAMRLQGERLQARLAQMHDEAERFLAEWPVTADNFPMFRIVWSDQGRVRRIYYGPDVVLEQEVEPVIVSTPFGPVALA